MTVTECIDLYVDGAEYNEPLFCVDMYKYAKSLHNDLDRGTFNTYLSRYVKQNKEVVRYQKGIYYKAKSTPFGYSTINYDTIISKFYLREGNNVIGYETGPSLLNKLGISTQIPKEKYIVTNNKRRRIKGLDLELILLDPIEKINNDNYRYLQLLDVINNKYKIQIETDDYYTKLEDFIDKYQLSYKKLIVYAKKYNSMKIYDILATIAQGV